MFKLLILMPFMLAGGALALAVALPLLIVVPVLFAVGALLVVPILVLRLGAAVLCGVGHLFVGLVGLAFALTAGVVMLVLGAHLLVPVLVVLAVIWIARRAARPLPPVLVHRP